MTETIPQDRVTATFSFFTRTPGPSGPGFRDRSPDFTIPRI